MTPNSLKSLNIQQQNPTQQGAPTKAPAHPFIGIQKPTDIRSSVEEKSLKIPDFLQKK